MALFMKPVLTQGLVCHSPGATWDSQGSSWRVGSSELSLMGGAVSAPPKEGRPEHAGKPVWTHCALCRTSSEKATFSSPGKGPLGVLSWTIISFNPDTKQALKWQLSVTEGSSQATFPQRSHRASPVVTDHVLTKRSVCPGTKWDRALRDTFCQVLPPRRMSRGCVNCRTGRGAWGKRGQGGDRPPRWDIGAPRPTGTSPTSSAEAAPCIWSAINAEVTISTQPQAKLKLEGNAGFLPLGFT